MAAAVRTSLQIQRDVVYALLLREISSRFGKGRVGFLWVLLEPVAHLVFPIAMFGLVLERTLPGIDYPVFLFYGFMPFLLFKSICLQTIEGTRASRGLLSYRQVLLMDVFVAKALAHCAVSAVVYAIVAAGLAFAGYEIMPALPLELGAVLVLAVLLGFGLGLVLAAIANLSPELRSVVRLLFLPLYVLSGVLLPIARFPDAWVEWLALNPVLHVVELARTAAVADYVPMAQLDAGYPTAIAAVALFVGLLLYRLRYLSQAAS